MLVEIEENGGLLSDLIGKFIDKFVFLVYFFLFESNGDFFVFDHVFSFFDLLELMFLLIFEMENLLCPFQLCENETFLINGEILSMKLFEMGLADRIDFKRLEFFLDESRLILE